MKKTQRLDAIRNIKKRVVSYLSICLVIMLGLGGFLTVIYAGKGIDAKAMEYYSERSFENMEMTSSLGVANEDIEKISKVEGVTDVEGVIELDGSLDNRREKFVVEIVSITEKVNTAELTNGTLPTKKNECAIGEDFAEESGLAIGDAVRITTDDTEMGNPLAVNEFTITGFVHHPEHLRRKSINTVVLPLAAFNIEATNDGFTKAFVVTNTDGDISIFAEEYFERESATKKRLEELTEELKVDTEARLKKKAEETIDAEWEEGKAEFEKAEQEIDDSEKKLNEELAAARDKLNSAESELSSKVADGERQLREAETTLDREVAAAEEQIAEAEAKHQKYQEVVDSVNEIMGPFIPMVEELVNGYYDAKDADGDTAGNVAEYVLDKEMELRVTVAAANDPDVQAASKSIREETGMPVDESVNKIAATDVNALMTDARGYKETGDTATGERLVEDADGIFGNMKDLIDDWYRFNEELALLQKQIDEGKAELASKESEGRSQIEANRNNLYTQKANGEAEIAAGWDEYNKNKEDYEKQIADAREKLASEYADAEKKVAEAKASLELPESEWIVLDRRANSGYVDMRSNSRALQSAGRAFGVLFLLITALVCFSTITIIIEEQKEMVGTAKAFGFFKREVLGKYLVFGGSAAVVGCILGILGSLALSELLQKEYAKSGMYQFGRANSIIAPLPTVAACVGIILICILATIIACTDVLKSPASILMKGGTSKQNAGEKKTVSGRGGSLYSRLIIRNMLNDKARVMVTIGIIAMSCMLMGVGFSLKFAYDGMPVKQMEDVYKYDVRLDLGGVRESEEDEVIKILEESGADYVPALYEMHIYRWDGNLDGLYILAAEPEALSEFYAISETGSKTPTEIPDDGVLVQNKMREAYNMQAGDVLTVLDSSLKAHEINIVGEFQNYIGRDIVISSEGYERIFGEYEPNCYFIKYNGADAEEIKDRISAVSDDVTFAEKDDINKKFEAVSMLYNLTIYISTGIAILMSFMILTNLANIFLNRKKRELIVMRVNGFSVKKTTGYLARETVLTTIIGIVLSVAIGAVVTNIVIRVLEQPDLQFVRTFNPLAWLIAAVLEVAFAVIVNSIVFKKVKKLNLKDIT